MLLLLIMIMMMTVGITQLSTTLVSPNSFCQSCTSFCSSCLQLTACRFLISPVSLDGLFSCILAGFNYIFLLAVYPLPFTLNTEFLPTLFIIASYFVSSAPKHTLLQLIRETKHFSITIQIKKLLLRKNKSQGVTVCRKRLQWKEMASFTIRWTVTSLYFRYNAIFLVRTTPDMVFIGHYILVSRLMLCIQLT